MSGSGPSEQTPSDNTHGGGLMMRQRLDHGSKQDQESSGVVSKRKRPDGKTKVWVL